jgi:hypothetical protein
MQRQGLEQQAEAIATAARRAHRSRDAATLIPQLEEAAAHYAQDEAPGSPYHHLAQFTRAVITLLQEDDRPLPPVPDAYAEMFAALQRDLTGPSSAQEE